LVVKQVPGPISFTSAEEPCRTAILKAFQNICLLPNTKYGILLRRQDLGLVLAVLQMVANSTQTSEAIHQSTFVLICIIAVLYDLDMFSTYDSKAFYFGETDFEYFTWLPAA
jgi:hypothetical protein